MADQRYSDEDAAAIFRLAAEQGDRGERGEGASTAISRLEGMTLAEIQAIGREVGLSPEALERAAEVVEVRKSAVTRRLLGLPIGVERRVNLGRRLTDEEWEHLVVELRDVFQARGRLKTEGSLRQWTNGNLYVLVEPTPSGDRLRLGSLHGGAASSIRMGLLAIGAGIAVGVAGAFSGGIPGSVSAFISGGLVMVAMGAFRVPSWARLRGRQMEELAAKLRPAAPSLPVPNALPARSPGSRSDP